MAQLVGFNTYFTRSLLLIFLFFFQKNNCQSQKTLDIGFEKIGVDKGLSSSIIRDINQDHQGFIWIAAYNGLDRYDGNNIVHYLASPDDSTALRSGLVKKIVIDSENNLWVVSNSIYLAKYNRSQNNFTSFSFKNKLGKPSVVTNVSDGLNNTLWIATLSDGIIKLNTKSESSTFIPIPEHDNSHVYQVYNSGDYLYLDMGDPSSLLKYNKQTNQIVKIRFSETTSERFTSYFSKSIHLDSTGVLWVGTVGNGLYRLDGDDIEWYSLENGNLSSNNVTSILDYNKEFIWVSTDGGGITILGKKGNFVQFLRQDHENPLSLALNTVHNLFKDRQGIVWVSTYGGGINRYDPNKYVFNKASNYSHNKQSLSSNYTLSFFEDHEGDIWVGTDGGGINKLIKPGHYDHFLFDAKEPNSVIGNVITTIQEDEKGQLWFGTFGSGISMYNKKTGQFTNHKAGDDLGLRNNTTWIIIKDKQETLWFGMEEGNVARYNNTLNRYEYLENNASEKGLLSTLFLFEDSNGVLWCSFRNNGLWKIDKKNMSINKVDLNKLNFFSINHILEDSEHRIWMATERFGLVELLEDNGKYSFKKMPLLENGVLFARAIVEDDEGFIWLSSNKGIFKFDKSTQQSQHFTTENGLHGNQFSFGACLKAKNGTIYFGGTTGYSYFNPSNIENKVNTKNIEITNFTIFDDEVPISSHGVLEQSILETDKVTLNYNQTTIGFEFTELNFAGASEKRFCYILEGFDKEWFTNKKETKVRYTNLSPGTYTFIVKPSKNHQCLDDNARSLSIVVLPPWWSTWWFKIIIWLVVILSILMIIKKRTASLQNQKNKLEHEIINRTEQITEQNDELLATNEELMATNDQLVETMNHLEATQDKLVKSEKMASLGVLTAGIAHEINNPINFVYAGANSLEDNLAKVGQIVEAHNGIDKDNYEKKLAKIDELKAEIQLDRLMRIVNRTIANIKDGAERVSEIVKGLNIFSSVGNDTLIKSDIHKSLDRSLVLLKHKYSEKAKIEKNYSEFPMIDCYPNKLEQVFINIISNASDAINENGKISLATKIISREGKEYAHISIKDNGQGMTEQVKKRIFEPFYSTKEVGSGTGLGLAISHGIIENHQGLIEVESEVGKGTTFNIYIPIYHIE
ncbi:MAG: ATP-binding protein [Cyclobacteriaceae bacterium]|nr:ATP-binding protein [Cyclobacteriaceae bacterium]